MHRNKYKIRILTSVIMVYAGKILHLEPKSMARWCEISKCCVLNQLGEVDHTALRSFWARVIYLCKAT